MQLCGRKQYKVVIYQLQKYINIINGMLEKWDTSYLECKIDGKLIPKTEGPAI